MNNYFYLENGAQKGPVSVEELKHLGLDGNTLVWCKGMKDWQPASEVAELCEALTKDTPPPPPTRMNAAEQRPPEIPPHADKSGPKNEEPTNYMVYAILATIFCCLPTGIASVIYANKATTSWTAGRYEEAIDATKKARIWLIISICVGVVSIIIGFIFGVFSALL